MGDDVESNAESNAESDAGSVILGTYCFKEGGSIYLPMGDNLKFQSGQVSEAHEIYHAQLQGISVAGILMNILDLEQAAADSLDQRHAEHVQKINLILEQRTRKIHEIYANSMELASLYQYGGLRAVQEGYNSKTKEYREFSSYFYELVQDTHMDHTEKCRQITLLCKDALHMDVASEEWRAAVGDGAAFQAYLDCHGYFDERFYGLYQEWKKGNGKSGYQKVQWEPEVWIGQLKHAGLIKYCSDMVEHALQNIDRCMIDEFDYVEKLAERVKAFDLSHIRVRRDIGEDMLRQEGVLVIKNCYNLGKAEDVFVIGRADLADGSWYSGYEWSGRKLEHFLEKAGFLMIPFMEYDSANECAGFLPAGPKMLFVLLEDFSHCLKWIQRAREKGELYIGDLTHKENDSCFTVLFFNPREKPDTVFVYPVTRRLAENLKRSAGLDGQVLYADQPEFLKLFAGFDDLLEVLKSFQWLLAFFTDSRVAGIDPESPHTWLGIDLFRSIGNVMFQINPERYLRNLHCLPTKRTVGTPFWALMEFSGACNTGKTYSVGGNLLLFRSREAAQQWKEQCQIRETGIRTYEAAGIDLYYWEFLKKYLLHMDAEVYILGNEENGKASVVEIDGSLRENS